MSDYLSYLTFLDLVKFFILHLHAVVRHFSIILRKSVRIEAESVCKHILCERSDLIHKQFSQLIQ